MFSIEITIAFFLAYLLGSVSSAVIVCRVMGLPDPRTQGSGNPGATNVLRMGDKRAAILTLFGDILKGFVPVYLGHWYGWEPMIVGGIAVFAFLGHLYPIFFRFEGGKGVATLIGCLLALSWPAGGTWMLIWIAVALLFRYASLASLSASLFSPLYVWYFTHQLAYTWALGFMTLLLIWRHRNNILQLYQGNERKIKLKRK